MRVFVAGGTGAVGRALVPALITAGHQVTASTRSAGRTAQLRALGAEPVVADGLDRAGVIAAVKAAAPDVIVHQMTALSALSSFRKFDAQFAATNELRTKGTDYLLEAADAAGVRRVVAQRCGTWTSECQPRCQRGSCSATAASTGLAPPSSCSIAYGMTGSVADAEDIVQDAYVGLARAERAGTDVAELKAYLATAVTRLAINHLRSARVRREAYVGDWLPEPVVVPADEPAEHAELAGSLSMEPKAKPSPAGSSRPPRAATWRRCWRCSRRTW